MPTRTPRTPHAYTRVHSHLLLPCRIFEVHQPLAGIPVRLAAVAVAAAAASAGHATHLGHLSAAQHRHALVLQRPQRSLTLALRVGAGRQAGKVGQDAAGGPSWTTARALYPLAPKAYSPAPRSKSTQHHAAARTWGDESRISGVEVTSLMRPRPCRRSATVAASSTPA